MIYGATHTCLASAQTALSFTEDLQKKANSMMLIMGYSLTPDVTTGSLSITDKSTNNPALKMISFGGGDRISEQVPLYLEGTVAINRYDPSFNAGTADSSTLLPVRWNSISGTGGIGWDFNVTKEFRFRPIFNVTLGHLESDASIFNRALEDRTGKNLDFLNRGRLNVYGAGGSLMLDYENYKPEREIDFEARFTYIPLNSFDSSAAVRGHSDSQSFSLWSRSRTPTSMRFFDIPIRHVLELAHTQFLGDMRGSLGFNSLTSVGTGIELDRRESDPILTRIRLMFRFQFGQNVQGTSIGIAASF
ncbi:hypothetical protein AOC33_04975 [Polynucleobacter cosmopolitanus]|uniref:Autotransporter domain-containing protein n=1 Tax=Polynucleobacter cosmopolitanus TaxID=351345 RepID=A0A229FX53_9BURK|nr:hypothetical protein AOC33_04975 [Polynucleobacter cosmopolitanus]